MKPYLYSASIGITIGLSISLLMSAIFGHGTYLPLNPASTLGQYYLQHFNLVEVMLISALIWATIGLLFQIVDRIFKQDWSLVKMTVVHFLLTAVGFTLLGLLAGWFPLNLTWLLFFEIIFVIIYVIIFFINYHNMKKQVRAINQGLRK
ncbi:DUF3021 family protein [Streptococcus sp. zg-86]|uniref:DUF3021 family protein n=1 Tax=Streptococcus zhangguiae TaxID=2664091 RepID=A0A6I4R6Y2_9STRE|nr:MULTISPECIES: DUF3021 domain-containing protein [unclassified Streptococcus]MTB63466.1 DUF3021 family protein [Streptococcus sp. zg-86]MTB89885.1 DUF3021 family protein [Streptococcus sp. zg-36]MWV55556.1 DUF3021 family protein [Streptococcus sp. zg-70]QTH47746.1 DUF3021 domain-containing protein [Streptococcus sp. zg-86]